MGQIPCTLSAFAHYHLKEVCISMQAAWVPHSVSYQLFIWHGRHPKVHPLALFFIHSFTHLIFKCPKYARASAKGGNALEKHAV